MMKLHCIAACVLLVAAPAQADESVVAADVPAGVIIYDAVNTPAPAPATDPAPVSSQSPASTRSLFAQPLSVDTGIGAVTLPRPAAPAPQINLSPGETVLRTFAASPAIISIPKPTPAYTLTSGPPPAQRPGARAAGRQPVVDPFSGRLRDTPGWTGRKEAPASIGCFPAGACAVLNQR